MTIRALQTFQPIAEGSVAVINPPIRRKLCGE
jgi:hypothetical protein